MIGKTISHYKIVEKIGGGGMGIVYKAQDLNLERFVALKFLPSAFSFDEDSKKRFILEAKAASSLQHNNICTIHDIDECDEQIFISMEFYDGETLKKKVNKGIASINEAIEIIKQIASGLQKSHEKGIVHRDIKPANIFITNDGVVKILDFGLAKLSGISQLTQKGSTVGTAAYMSPEQARGDDVDSRTDIWSLGIIMYEMLVGEAPFKSDYEQAMIYAILNEEPKPIEKINPEVPDKYAKIIYKCLQKDPEKRYQNVSELLSDLREDRESFIRPTKYQPGYNEHLKKYKYIYFSAISLLVLIVGYLLIFQKPVSSNNKSIAVLPFLNLSGTQEDEFFCEGITEDILMQLSKIGDLKVISRTTVMQYKGTKKTLKEIAEELNVANILEGSIRRADDQVRIVAQLIDASSDQHIWAETYDKEFKQIFAIQSDVAKKIAQALKVKLSSSEKERIEKIPTQNMTAYEYYLSGRNYYYRYTKNDNDIAIEQFKKAIELDPNYAIAWAGMGDAFAQKFGRFANSMNWVDSALWAGNMAIKIDPNSADGYKALGTAYIYKGMKNNSFDVLRKAIERNPNYYPAIANLGITYAEAGELDEALKWLKKTVELNPADIFAYSEIGEIYRKLKMNDKAEEWFKKSIKIQPDYSQTYYYYGLLQLEKGKKDETKKCADLIAKYNPTDYIYLEQGQKLNELSGNFSEAKLFYQNALIKERTLLSFYRSISAIGLANILIKEGNKEEAYKLLDSSLIYKIKEFKSGSELMELIYAIAGIYSIQNKKDEAVTWLQKAIDKGWRDYSIIEKDPWFVNIRNDNRYSSIVNNLKNKIESMRKKVEAVEV